MVNLYNGTLFSHKKQWKTGYPLSEMLGTKGSVLLLVFFFRRWNIYIYVKWDYLGDEIQI